MLRPNDVGPNLIRRGVFAQFFSRGWPATDLSVAGSSTWRLLAGLPIAALAASMIPAQVAEHRTADPSFECPKCHWTGVASLKSFVVGGPSRAVQPKLGDGDPMNRRI